MKLGKHDGLVWTTESDSTLERVVCATLRTNVKVSKGREREIQKFF